MNRQLAALRFVTRCLNDSLNGAPTLTLRKEIQSGHVPWEEVIALANNHLLTPALWVALGKKNLREVTPGDIQAYLTELHQMSVDRNAHLKSQLLEAVEKLNSINVSPVLLKGAKHLLADDYGDPGARIMSDIDLLVRRDETEKCMDILSGLGYQPTEDIHNDYHAGHHHCPPLFRPGDYAVLEIHRRIMDTPFDEILDTGAALRNARPFKSHGLAMQILSPADRILHNMLHTHLVDKIYVNGLIPLRSMHEVKTECAALGEQVDWTGICERMLEKDRGKALHAYLYMANRLFGLPLPAGISRTLRSRLHYMRCCGQLRWRWMSAWGARAGKYSSDNVQKLFGCSGGWVPVNMGRFRMLIRRFSSTDI